MREQKVFIVTLDLTDPALEVSEVRKRLTSDSRIGTWWNHLPGVYLVKTDLTANELSELVKHRAGNANFLVAEVNLAESEGWLPDTAWQWIRKREREAGRTESAV